MTNFFEALLKFLSELTLKRLLILVVIAGAVLAFFVAYESYTGYFEFSKLKRATELLEKLNKLKNEDVQQDPELKKIYLELVARTHRSLTQKNLLLGQPYLSLKYGWTEKQWQKFMGGAWLWVAFALFALIGVFRKRNKLNAVWGMLFFSFLCGLIGLAIPAFLWPWLHFAILPVIEIATIMLPIVYFSKRPAKQKA